MAKNWENDTTLSPCPQIHDTPKGLYNTAFVTANTYFGFNALLNLHKKHQNFQPYLNQMKIRSKKTEVFKNCVGGLSYLSSIIKVKWDPQLLLQK